VTSLTRRAPVAAMIECVDGIATRDEVADHVAIAAAVLAEAVDDGDNRARAGIRLPALIVQALRAGAAEPTFLVRHAA